MPKVFVFGDISYDYALKYEPMEDEGDSYGVRAQHHRRWDVEESFTLKGGAHLLVRLLEHLTCFEERDAGTLSQLFSMTADPRHRAISAWEGIPRVVSHTELSDNEIFLDTDGGEHIFRPASDDGKPKKVRRFFLKSYYGRILDDRIIRDEEQIVSDRFAVSTSDEALLCASDIIVGYNTDRDNRYFPCVDDPDQPQPDAPAPAAAAPPSAPAAATPSAAAAHPATPATSIHPATAPAIPVLEALAARDDLESKVIVLRSTFARKKVPTAFLRTLQGHPLLIRRTVLVLNVDELRHAGFNIEQGISWEKLVQQTVAALRHLRETTGDFLSVVVCFNHNGCLVYSKDEYKLFFYSSEIEGDLYPGASQVFGEAITLQAAIIKELLMGEGPLDVRAALYRAARSGLVGIRSLIETGFILKDYQGGDRRWSRSINRRILEFPYRIVKDVLFAARGAQEGQVVAGLRLPAEVTIPIDALREEDFSILHMVTRDVQELRKYCQDIVQHGFIKRERRRIPHLRFGNSLVYTRREIEEFRVVRNAFRTYIKDAATEHPISFCVFGPPGAGKSFVVRQIEREVRKEVATEFIECNLSQMENERDLLRIYHRVRDTGLQGQLPIVFFDEFDAQKDGQPYYWLKQFLAPMQDGKFYENGVTHYLGRAILVFAGGINKSWELFRERAEKDREAKGLDFLSRIRGYIDVSGLNPEDDKAADFPFDAAGELDKEAVELCVRRAILLRAIIELKIGLHGQNDNYLPVDDAVVDAFVFVKEYRHGSRSLQTIIEMSDIARRHKSIDALCIMNSWQDLHVSEDFGRLLQDGWPASV
ncbi:MAG: ATP-binding protein [Coriobacteriales bacterium]|jgi:hypothetical protein|nr:ATP-binding protein [Coriobacteriales bacterium]